MRTRARAMLVALAEPAAALAWFRLLAALAGVLLVVVDHATTTLFWGIWAVGAGVTGTAVVFAVRDAKHAGGHSVRPELFAVASVASVAALLAAIAATGDASSQARWLLPLMPPVLAPFYPPRRLAATCGALAAGYLALSGPAIVQGRDGALDDVLVTLIVLGLAAVAAGVAALMRLDAQARIDRLDTARRELLERALTAEYQARRDLSSDLYDETLQHLLTARQDIDEAAAGDRPALEFARTNLDQAITRVRELAAALHPVALEHGGLGAAVAALAAPLREAGVRVELHVDAEADGVADDLVVPIVQELVDGVSLHSAATTVAIWVLMSARQLEVVVSDNGGGFRFEDGKPPTPGRGQRLTFAAERADLAGGSLSVRSGEAGGSTVRVRLPVPVRRVSAPESVAANG